jgi:hypothetical protein
MGCRLLAQPGRAKMSAIRSLSDDKQTKRDANLCRGIVPNEFSRGSAVGASNVWRPLCKPGHARDGIYKITLIRRN